MGRDKKEIDYDVVDYCRRKHFEWIDIAAIIDVHRDTLLNRRKVHYPDVDDHIHPLTEDELSTNEGRLR